MRGGSKTKEQGPPINASSKEEEQFIQYVWSTPEHPTADICREFIRNAEAEEKKDKAAH